MLPIPFIDYVPSGYTRDAKLTAFCDKIDSILTDLKDDTTGLNTFIDPMRIPANLISELGYLLNAGINPFDDETTRRKKVATAVAGHKKRGSFVYDAKPKIDIIAGGDSEIFRAIDEDDWILVGDGLTPAAYYWASMGADGIDDELGLSLIGSGLEVEVAGNIYIDVDNAALSAAEQESIRVSMLDIVPAYFYVHFGYVNGLGQFVEYFYMGA